jgi:hypothetical protein
LKTPSDSFPGKGRKNIGLPYLKGEIKIASSFVREAEGISI